MIIEFADTELERLARGEKCKSKQMRSLPKGVVKGYLRALTYLRAAKSVESLYGFKGLAYRKLEGNDYERVKLNDQYRLLFKTRIEGDEIKVTVAQLHKISNHYEDL